MVLMSFIGLFTTRVILNALGVSDLGLMSAAGSIVGMFTFLNGTLMSGTMRFLTYSIGEGDTNKLKKTFACAMTLHLAMAAIILLLAETIGLWYIHNHLVYEPGRFHAAMWCYQLSVFSTVIGIILIPFNSALVAHEHMGMYAYMSIFDAGSKLLAAYLLMIVPWDRLIFYSTLSFFTNFIPTFIYNWYCRKHFAECAFIFGYDKDTIKSMLSFSGWNAIGCLADMGRGTGMNLIINAFFGTAVNGARSISLQANNWIYKFVDSFITAIRPQVTKAYASGDYTRMADLVCYGTSFATYLYLFLGIPLFIEIEWILTLWLGQCPEHCSSFLRIVMIQLMFQTLGQLTVTAMHATGKMKAVNLTVGLILLSIVPISYLLSKMGNSSELVLSVCVIPWIIVPFVRVFWVNKYSKGTFPIKRYFINTYIKTCLISIIMFIPPYYMHIAFMDGPEIQRIALVGLTNIIFSCLVIYYIGLDTNMRYICKSKINKYIHKEK